MNRTHVQLINLVLITCLALALCSCAAVQSPIGAGATFYGLKSVVQQAPGTFVMQANNMILMAWPTGAKYAFALFCDGACPLAETTGRVVQTMSFSETVRYLESCGWTYMQPENLPTWITSALATGTVEAMVAAMRSLPSIWMVPVIILTPQWNPEIQS
jgi:hypothetical protein